MDNFELLKTIYPKTFFDLSEKLRPVSESSLLDPCLEFSNKESTQVLIDILCKKPFPSWQFVSYIKNGIKLEEEIFNKVTETIFQFTENYQWKIFNFLANFDPPSNECVAKILEILYEKKITLQSYLYKCLLSRENDLLLEKYLDFERSNETTYSRKTILHYAICQKVHFLEIMLENKQTKEVADEVLRNAIILSRIVSQIDLDVIYNNHPFASEVNQISSVCSDKLNNDQKTVYMDLSRVKNVINVLTKLSNEKVTMSQIVESKGLLEIVYKYVNLSETSYQEVHSYIEQHRSVSLNDNEDLQIFSCFIILSIVIDTVVDDGDFTSKETQSKLLFMLRQVKKTEIFLELVDSIYKLLLLRCNSTNEKQEKQNVHNLDNSDANNETVCGNNRQKYFVCSKTALYNILKFLKDIIAKRIHLKNDEEMCKKLRERLSLTNQVLWKYELIEKYYEKDNCRYELNNLNSFITPHAEAHQQISSDEEASESGRDSNILRKKTRPKKRPKSLKYNRTDTNERERNEKLQSPEKDTDNIITKILITPQSLCLLCLSHTDIVEARNIIKAFSLHNTEFENEVYFLDNCEQTRKKLEPIFNKYIKQELQNTDSVSTIEQIKTCANVGFEASRIINIIEKFAHTNRVKPLIEDDSLIDKYRISFPYLEQYKTNALQSTVIIDLVLNLANNYEITYNILSVIEKNYGLSSTFTSASSNQISSEHQNIGCIEFFRDLVNCLQATDNNASVKDVLNNCCYTLKPAKLKYEQEKELVFDMIYSKINDSEDSDVLKAYSIFFEMLDSKANYFNRFTNYLTNLSKLLNLKGKDATNANELMSVNTKNVIGELLFEHDLLPSDIENIVNTLNLNLSHLIALNFCSLAMDDTKRDTTAISKDFTSYSMQKTANSLYSYIEGHSSLLSYLLQTINHQKPSLFEKLDQYFQKYCDLTDIHILSTIYNRNLRLTAIFSDYVDMDRFSTLTDKTLIKDICRIFDIEHTKNETIHSLIKDDISNVMLIELINDINLRTKIFIEYTTKIKDYETIERLTKSIILDKNNSLLRPEYKEKLEINLKNISIFAKVASLLELPSWFSASGSGHKTHDITMKILLKKSEFEVAYMWSQVIGFPEYIAERRQLLHDIFLPYLHKEDAQNDVYFLKIIESFPRNLVIEFYESNFNKFKTFSLITHIVDYLDQCNGQDKVELKNYKISLKILEFMSEEERENNWNLMKDPLLMLEQLIMNTKFESLSKILEQVRPLLGTTICQSCFDKRKMIRNITISGTVNGLGDPNNSEFILINFLLYQRHHVITNECIDLILRIYARKSLEYSVNGTYPSTEPFSQLSVAASLDSLCDTFVMPKEAPDRTDWVRDEAASSCMCCKRANFTMLTRRHHCRRCGRVVCYSCSTHRTLIPSLYKEIPVRTCRDCFVQIEASQNESVNKESNSTVECDSSKLKDMDWMLTANLTHDKLLRQEFCYEHSPSVALCLSILSFHKDDEECVQFLLYQCRKFEKLILEFPNPEVDYALVANMLNCLALAAKFRGGPPECNTIREHSEIVNAIVKNGSQSFLPKDDLNNITLRKLADSLVVAESWSLASDITVKCGCPATGIMAAHGFCCLKAGCFETAREKFIHCMNRLSCEHDNSAILAFIKSDINMVDSSEINIPVINRPNKSPILLQEVLKIIETTCRPTQPSILERTNVMRSSSTSLAFVRSKRKENILAHEPASNILNQIATLTQITQGNYSVDSNKNVDNISSVIRNSRMFEESLYYLLMYGTHADILNFLLKHKQIECVLKYFICQKVESDIFIENVFLKYMKNGKMNFLIDQMFAMDNTLSIWKDTIIQTCRFLEKKCLLNSLYQLQILLKDPIRASMTCVKFYSMNCSNFEQLHNNSYHLFNAKKHLQAELEICILEDVNFVNRKNSRTNEPSFVMRMDTKTINRHINTITRQLEVTKFLLACERNGKSVMNILKEITLDLATIPTLFDSVQSKIQLCILVLVCGKNIEEGFGLAYRIMQDYKLQYFKVYGITGKYLSRYDRLRDVEALINCIRSNNGHNATQLDEVIHLSISSASNINLPENKNLIDNLVRLVKNIELKISCYIHIGHLKSAYLLAVQYDRINDIRKIMRQAEITNQVYIKRLCEKKLNIKH